MDIFNATVLDLEKENEIENVELLRLKISCLIQIFNKGQLLKNFLKVLKTKFIPKIKQRFCNS